MIEIESVEFKNFKALQDTKLPLSRLTLIIGPNGSGKTSAITGLQYAFSKVTIDPKVMATLGDTSVPIEIKINWTKKQYNSISVNWTKKQQPRVDDLSGLITGNTGIKIMCYALDANAIANDVTLEPNMALNSNGANLAGVLDRLRDENPEKFEDLNKELNRVLPEFNRILFTTPSSGKRGFLLRTTKNKYQIAAQHLSQGTLLALAILTLAYMPNPPAIICLEEPEHGIHPRLLRDLQDALYRLAYPESYGENREPVQVIITSHSPYLLDLYQDHPEEIVIASKIDGNVNFERLSERKDIDEILADGHLSEIWYSGVLGGIPCQT